MGITRKTRYCEVGNLTDTASSMTYASIVIHGSARFFSVIAALNDLDIIAGEIQNASLNASTKEMVLLYACDEWKYDQGKLV